MKRAELDMEHPPGQIVNPVGKKHVGTLHQEIQEFLDTEDMFRPRTGSPPGMLQDDDSKLSKWLSNRPGARHLIKKG